jgi:hemoglobin-like flavoprotein
MTGEQLALVRETWTRAEPRILEGRGALYDRLFALDPGTRRLFAGRDLVEAERKLIGMLGRIAGTLGEPEALFPLLAEQGRRHVGYGIREADYETMGAALLWMLEQALGDELTPEARAAWREAYLLVTAVMRRAASPSLGSG